MRVESAEHWVLEYDVVEDVRNPFGVIKLCIRR